ncbi:MAG: DUF4157 domain-containing protein [Myxococcales bacterium]|nr:DUF4157 domain-containing protein [Myxococcales bacterium]
MVQMRADLAGMDVPTQMRALQPEPPTPGLGSLASVQFQGGGTAGIHQAAAQGVSGSGSQLPYLDTIQKSFGGHDVSGVSAHQDSKAQEANASMGSLAYASGNSVAFASSPDLHTAAHEAAHIVQQRQGVSLDGGVGKVGDSYEKHADAVADRVVSGKSAEDLLTKNPS